MREKAANELEDSRHLCKYEKNLQLSEELAKKWASCRGRASSRPHEAHAMVSWAYLSVQVDVGDLHLLDDYYELTIP